MEQFIVFSGDYSENFLTCQRVLARIYPTGMGGITLYSIAMGFILFKSSYLRKHR